MIESDTDAFQEFIYLNVNKTHSEPEETTNSGQEVLPPKSEDIDDDATKIPDEMGIQSWFIQAGGNKKLTQLLSIEIPSTHV